MVPYQGRNWSAAKGAEAEAPLSLAKTTKTVLKMGLFRQKKSKNLQPRSPLIGDPP